MIVQTITTEAAQAGFNCRACGHAIAPPPAGQAPYDKITCPTCQQVHIHFAAMRPTPRAEPQQEPEAQQEPHD